MSEKKYSGERVRRTQVDSALLTGKAAYVNDISLPQMLYMQILRSPYAHARIKSIETKNAETLPGVVLVLTGKQLVDMGYPLKGQVESAPGLKSSRSYSLAVDKVRFVGQAVAAVAAENRYAAEDALKLINVEYEPLPVVANAEKAMEPGSPLLYEEWKDNILYQVDYSEGDVEKAFKEADAVISDKLEIQR
jgi:carbon-monoxide dehydrogenase large subunit